MQLENPVDVLNRLIEKKDTDGILEIFGDEYIAMVEMVSVVFERYGYSLKVVANGIEAKK